MELSTFRSFLLRTDYLLFESNAVLLVKRVALYYKHVIIILIEIRLELGLLALSHF